MTDHTLLLEHLRALTCLTSTGFTPERVVTDRRGVAMVRGTLPDARCVGVKVVKPDAPDVGPYDPNEMLEREARWLAKYGAELAPEAYVTDGIGSGERWMMTRWFDGEPLDGAMRHTTDDNVSRKAEIFRGAAQELARLHGAGQVHGDLQPAHFLVSDTRTRMLDFSLSHELGRFDYRGAMIHFMAPEVAASILQDGRAAYDVASEMYAFGAVLFFSTVGQMPVVYPNPKAQVADKLRFLSSGNLVDGTVLREVIDERLASVVLECLHPDPKKRPSSAESISDQIGVSVRASA